LKKRLKWLPNFFERVFKEMSKAVTDKRVKHLYKFGEFTLDASERTLTRQGELQPLTPKAIDTLLALVRNSGHVVEKETLLKQIWPDTFVEESTLAQNIFTLRKVLGNDKNNGTQFIETVPKRGYRFIAETTEISETIDDNSAELQTIEPVAQIISAVDHQIDTQVSSQQSVVVNRRKKYALIAIAIIALLAITKVYLRQFRFRNAPARTELATSMKVARFTATGNSFDAAISPDGKYVVYAVNDAGRQSLWVRQVATSSRVQIVPPSEVSYQGLGFSHDSNYVFYNVWDRKSVGAIYKVSSLGGPSTKVVYNVMPSLSISPDGTQITFIRCEATTQSQMLMSASIDGSNEKIIALRDNHNPGWFSLPAWSPDGKTIACGIGFADDQGEGYMQLVEVSAQGGTEKILTPDRWFKIGGLAWLKNKEGLAMVAADQVQGPLQMWTVSYPNGKARKITNDLNGFWGLSMTADSTSLVAIQSEQMSNIWVAPQGDADKAIKITSGRYEGDALSWTPDGRIVFTSFESGRPDIWIMDADGSNKKQLTFDANSDFDPKVAADGRYIIFCSNRTGNFHLWRMNIDGSHQTQLTDGKGEWSPACTPSSNLVIYASADSGTKALWKIDVEGGKPTVLTSKYSHTPSLSPDGKFIAYSFWNTDVKPERWEREIISVETGQKIKGFDIPSSAILWNGATGFQWTLDSRALTYVNNRDGIGNIWSISLDGGASKELSNFKSDQIFSFAWSSDGKQLACSRGTATSDVVLITNFTETKTPFSHGLAARRSF
jgi:Tol biopolymer transport system component/DNA-binding winged helix-turn-helix (wHTH) protein